MLYVLPHKDWVLPLLGGFLSAFPHFPNLLETFLALCMGTVVHQCKALTWTHDSCVFWPIFLPIISSHLFVVCPVPPTQDSATYCTAMSCKPQPSPFLYCLCPNGTINFMQRRVQLKRSGAELLRVVREASYGLELTTADLSEGREGARAESSPGQCRTPLTRWCGFSIFIFLLLF